MFATVGQTIPLDMRPSLDFLNAISAQQQDDVLRATLLVYTMTNGLATPREFQHRAAFGPLSNTDSFVVAGTGSGKTLVMALPCVLRPKTISLVLCPTK
ncbi:hypothetical protein PLICRDRAFT_106501, partial [Plicaturopsis crispa FD-325 SS-3]